MVSHTRRSHPKSRRGCTTCKNRHVKCDEAGPPCGRCKLRGSPCEYATPTAQPNEATATKKPAKAPVPCLDPSSEADDEPVFPPSRHLLELQLMHRWSTRTYRSCCTPGSGDDDVWRVKLPGLAIQHDYLLYGMFAMAAFETAKVSGKTPDRENYLRAAIEYHGLALGRYQSQLPSITPATQESALCMSMMLLCLTFASAQATANHPAENGAHHMVNAVITHVKLLDGCTPVLDIDPEYLAKNLHVQKLVPFENLPRTAVDADMDRMLTTVNDLNDKRILNTVNDPDDQRVRQVARWDACKRAILVLRECYEKCVSAESRGYCLGWPNLAGKEYIAAVEERDPLALAILLYWGVLAHQIGQMVWWAEDFGALLVAEIIRDSGFHGGSAELREAINFAQLLAGRSETL